MITRIRRASPLAPEDRRSAIIDSAIPLIIEHGRSVTTREIAEQAGIAEGTLFRAFGDKDTLIRAAVERFFDPEPLRNELRAVPAELPIDRKVLAIVLLMQARFRGIFSFMAALGGVERPPSGNAQQEFARIIAQKLAPELDQLGWPPERVAQFIRLVAFASAFPQLNEGVEFDPRELTSIILYGVTGQPAPDKDQPC